jgi:hypothetical protein
MLGQVMLQIGESASLSVTRPSHFFGTLLRKPSPGTHHPPGGWELAGKESALLLVL